MWSWIWIVALYLLAIGGFRWLGGIGAAGEAVERWGRAMAERWRRTAPSPSS